MVGLGAKLFEQYSDAELLAVLGLPEDAPWPVVEAYCVRVLAAGREGLPPPQATATEPPKPRAKVKMIKSRMPKLPS